VREREEREVERTCNWRLRLSCLVAVPSFSTVYRTTPSLNARTPTLHCTVSSVSVTPLTTACGAVGVAGAGRLRALATKLLDRVPSVQTLTTAHRTRCTVPDTRALNRDQKRARGGGGVGGGGRERDVMSAQAQQKTHADTPPYT
jgi:hypothetical protein